MIIFYGTKIHKKELTLRILGENYRLEQYEKLDESFDTLCFIGNFHQIKFWLGIQE